MLEKYVELGGYATFLELVCAVLKTIVRTAGLAAIK